MSIDLSDVLAQLEDFLRQHPKSTLPRSLQLDRDELIHVLSSGLSSLEELRAQVEQLTAQLAETQAALDASTTARAEASPVPATHTSTVPMLEFQDL